jgi:hypothetical protein
MLLQRGIEATIFTNQQIAEETALNLLQTHDEAKARNVLQSFQEETCDGIVAAWWDFFWVVVVKYRDIMK